MRRPAAVSSVGVIYPLIAHLMIFFSDALKTWFWLFVAAAQAQSSAASMYAKVPESNLPALVLTARSFILP